MVHQRVADHTSEPREAYGLAPAQGWGYRMYYRQRYNLQTSTGHFLTPPCPRAAMRREHGAHGYVPL